MKKQYTVRTGKLGKETYVLDPKVGGYTAFFQDFKNIVSEGKTIDDAQKNLWNTLFDVLKHVMKNYKNEFCSKSPNKKHEYVLPPDSFDMPYCKHCYKGS